MAYGLPIGEETPTNPGEVSPGVDSLVNRTRGRLEQFADGLSHRLAARLEFVEQDAPVGERRILAESPTHCIPHILGAAEIPQQLGPEPRRQRLWVLQESSG